MPNLGNIIHAQSVSPVVRTRLGQALASSSCGVCGRSLSPYAHITGTSKVDVDVFLQSPSYTSGLGATISDDYSRRVHCTRGIVGVCGRQKQRSGCKKKNKDGFGGKNRW